MNKNDKFHGEEFEVNAQAISDENLEGVSGGCHEYCGRPNTDADEETHERCYHCGKLIHPAYFSEHLMVCDAQYLMRNS